MNLGNVVLCGVRAERLVMSLVGVALLAAMGIFGGGCASPGRYDVSVAQDEKLKGAAMEVDIIGVNNEAALADWETVDVGKYFSTSPDSKRSNTANRYTMKFSPNSPTTQTLSAQDKVWEAWQKPRWLIILADIPQYASTGNDKRRVKLSTMTDHWEGKLLSAQVSPSGVSVLTPEKTPH